MLSIYWNNSENPPVSDGSNSLFRYDWQDLTQLEVGRRGPALMKTLVGEASPYKGLLD